MDRKVFCKKKISARKDITNNVFCFLFFPLITFLFFSLVLLKRHFFFRNQLGVAGNKSRFLGLYNALRK